jgi:hypothetical protein
MATDTVQSEVAYIFSNEMIQELDKNPKIAGRVF